jgi:hypothetical protein
MTEAKKTRAKRPRQQPKTYIHRPGAVCITIHSQDGSPVPRSVLNEASDAVWEVAQKNNLLINLADA